VNGLSASQEGLCSTESVNDDLYAKIKQINKLYCHAEKNPGDIFDIILTQRHRKSSCSDSASRLFLGRPVSLFSSGVGCDVWIAKFLILARVESLIFFICVLCDFEYSVLLYSRLADMDIDYFAVLITIHKSLCRIIHDFSVRLIKYSPY
jgi:hypothetical protein